MSSLRLALKLSMAENQPTLPSGSGRKMSFSEDEEKKSRVKRKRDDETSSIRNSEGGGKMNSRRLIEIFFVFSEFYF